MSEEFLESELDLLYLEMAADQARETEALEWVEETVKDISGPCL